MSEFVKNYFLSPKTKKTSRIYSLNLILLKTKIKKMLAVI